MKKRSEENINSAKLISIGQLATNLSHDIRNAIHAIAITTGAMKTRNEGQLNEKDKKDIERIERVCQKILHQINDVMDFVKMSPLSLKKSSINEIVDSVLERIEVLPNINIIKPEKNIQITCDQVKMESVILNIILNAIQAVGERGQIIITAEESSSNILIKIQDSGPGVPREIMKKIFEPLVITKPKGTGLGLSICKNFVEQHKGTIRVKNNPTTFSISLPKMNF